MQGTNAEVTGMWDRFVDREGHAFAGERYAPSGGRHGVCLVEGEAMV